MAFSRILEQRSQARTVTMLRFGCNPITGKVDASPDLTFSSQFYDYKRKSDDGPTGKFIPGRFKVTPVRLEKVTFTPRPMVGSYTIPAAGPKPVAIWGGEFYRPVIEAWSSAYLPVTIDSTIQQRVYRAAQAGVNSPDADYGEMAAEIGETIRMIANPIAGMAKILKNIFKPKPKSFKRKSLNPANVCASRWLEYRYGWMPLASSVQDAISKSGLSFPEIMHSRASESTDTTQYQSARFSDYTYNFAFLLNLWKNQKTTYRCVVYYHVTDQAFYTSIKRGTTILNVPTLAWQLVPLSFAVDWWFNVGDWLYAAMPNPAVSILGVTHSLKVTERLTQSVRFCGNWAAPREGTYPWCSCNGHMYRDREYYDRSVQIGPPPNVPLFDSAFHSIKHSLDAAALAWQRAPSIKTMKRLLN